MQFSLLEDASAPLGVARSRLYQDPCVVLGCTAADQIKSLLHQAEAYLAQGWYAVYLGRYELAGDLHQVKMHASADPLFEIQFYRSYKTLDVQGVEAFLSDLQAREVLEIEQASGIYGLTSSCDQPRFEASVATLQDYLRAGHSYQINLTYRLFFKTYGSAIALYRRLRKRQPVAYGALIKLKQGWVLSFSPELFVRRTEGRLLAKPMKGTAPRSGVADTEEAVALANDEKNKTENLIIVDLLRNDLGRISLPGSVAVPQLFEVEAHPTVWQMTSTITSQSHSDLDLYTLLQALFPCGSVTGAPKRRSLEIITELETHPRRLYCGALGWIDPAPQAENVESEKGDTKRERLGDFCFSVPIRTVLLDKNGHGELGIGAGITYDSSAAAEYAECQLKAKFLTDLKPDFSLIETMAMDKHEGYLRLPLHLQRLKYSAEVLGFNYQEEKILASLQAARIGLLSNSEDEGGASAPDKINLPRWRARLVLDPDGQVDVQLFPLNAITLPVRLFWAKQTVRSDFFLVRHKTTHRAFYDDAWQAAECKGGFDTIFCNERAEVTEGGRSNLIVQIDDEWLTPSIECGLLPGVMRADLLAQGKIREAVLTKEDILAAQALYICSSLRGILPAILTDQVV